MSSGVTTRYLGIARGAVVITGNTFGLDKRAATTTPDPYNPGNLGSAGVFMTLSNTTTYPTNWASIYTANQTPSPVGILRTSDVSSSLKIGSSARLYIPTTTERILHAELVWFANINASAGVNSNATIEFVHPNVQNPLLQTREFIDSSKFKVRYDLTTQEIQDTWRIYVRSADVTSYIVKGENTYSVEGVSAAIRAGSDESNCSGWCLMVAYEDPTMDYNNLSMYVMCVPVSGATSTVEIAIPNIVTPSSGALKGKAVMAAAEGDVKYTGDYVTFGAATNPTTRLSVGSHVANNFFVGEISIGDNDPDIGGTTVMGAPDRRGSMGNNNHNATNTILGARQGIDITRVDISQTLSYNQKSAFMDFGTSGDVYIPVAFGAQINVYSSMTKSVNITAADITDTIRYRTTIVNNGSSIAWRNVFFRDPLPPGVSFVNGTVRVYYNNVLQPAFNQLNPVAGFLLKPSLSGTDVVIVDFDAVISDFTLVPNCTIVNQSTITYTITDSSGTDFDITETSPAVQTRVEHGNLMVTKTNDPPGVVTCTNVIQYTIKLENNGCVNTVVNIGGFRDPLPAGIRYVGNVTSSSNQAGYDNTSIAYNSSMTEIVNVKQLTVRPSEIITIVFAGTPIC